MLSNPEKPRHPAQDTYDAQQLARQDAFLEAYKVCGTITSASKAISIAAYTVHLWKQQDAQGFNERLAMAQVEFGEFLEDLALQKVQRLDSKDNLLHIAMLNANRPDKYHRNDDRTPSSPVRVTSITINMPDGVKMPLPTPEVTEGSYQELPSASNPDATDTVKGPDTPVS